jgi:peptide-methionine (S)-S-oxide reductase
MQQLLRGCDGVRSTRTGWTGDENDHPTEENNIGHPEAVESRSIQADLLSGATRVLLQIHRADLGPHLVGSSYRSEIFYTSEEQRRVAEQTIRDVDASGHWPGKIVTDISGAGPFWEAEAEDQDYFERYPKGCAPPFPRHGLETAGREGGAQLA